MRRSPRHGFALPAAIIALVLLSALVAGMLFVSTEEVRAGRGDVADQQALAAAESALEQAVVSWDPRRNTRDTVGQTVTLVDSARTPNDQVTVMATRVERRSVWLTSSATDGGDGRRAPARRTIAASLRLVTVSIPERAALTALGTVSVANGIVDGRDAAVTDDASGVCTDDGRADAAGVSVPAAANVVCGECSLSTSTGVFGTPPVDSSTPPPGDSVAARTRSAARSALAARVTVEVAGGAVVTRPRLENGECDRRDPLNWGDPAGATPCADYYPVVRARGDLTLAGGALGQGILLVEGTLRVEAGARFVGVVMASGDILVTGPGAEITGEAFADDAAGRGESSVTAGGAIRFGRCAIRRAVLGSARLTHTKERWWVELR